MRSEPQRPRPIICWGSQAHPNLQSLSTCENIYLAYSGGIDSHVLLHLCASDAQLKNKITAVYINHGLQKEATAWSKHCESVCERLSVKFLSLTVKATAKQGESPEEAARNARYAALKPLLGKEDVLLLAQHSEDQLETVLLQLFRGSGLKGLSGMPESMVFGEGRLVRPLLDVSKAQIIEYAKSHVLEWVEDPSNQQDQFDRNFLRNGIIPLLKQRWPSLAKTVSRSAQHCAESHVLIDRIADDLFNTVFDAMDDTLWLSKLKTHSSLERQLVLRQWFRFLGLKMPSQVTVQRILAEAVMAKADAGPVISVQGRQVRRFRDKLYCIKPVASCIKETILWPVSESMLKLSADTVYEIVESTRGIPKEQWLNSAVTAHCRSGGETLRLPGRNGRHSLKNLFQEAGVPVWERTSIPLFYMDDTLAAVGEYWVSDGYYSEGKEPCFRIVRRKINPKANDD